MTLVLGLHPAGMCIHLIWVLLLLFKVVLNLDMRLCHLHERPPFDVLSTNVLGAFYCLLHLVLEFHLIIKYGIYLFLREVRLW